MYKISIITPNYNYAQYLDKLLISIINQNYNNWEHIVVDDGSTDNSLDIINNYVERYPQKIKLISQENKGQTYAINRALKEAKGDIIGWINSDDYYAKDIFKKIIGAFEQDETLDAVFGDIGIINKNGELIKVNKYLRFDYPSGVFIGFGKIISSNAIFWKKNLSDEIGFLDESYVYAMDSEYWSRLLYNKKVKKLNFTFAYFRWHPKSKTILGHRKNSLEYIKANEEKRKITEQSYQNLRISKYIPFNYTKLIKYYYKIKRYSLRALHGHYYLKK